MKFIDECSIKLFAGQGGDGAVHFKQGTPLSDGGSGGKGGSIYIMGSTQENTLLNISSKKEYHASKGFNGGDQDKTGKTGEDLILYVPLGTQIFVNNKLIKNVNEAKPFLIAKGGNGGKGNKLTVERKQITKNYKFEKGHPGEIMECELKLETIADVGFIGKPSAGKSTVLSVISNTKPKIADYDFTTLVPQLGLVRVSSNKSFVAIDLPGLIARNSIRNKVEEDTLKTIARCRTIAYVIDFGDPNKDPVKDFEELKQELKNYSNKLKDLPTIIVANKMDMPNYYERINNFKKKNPDLEIIKISALQKKNIKELKFKIFNML